MATAPSPFIFGVSNGSGGSFTGNGGSFTSHKDSSSSSNNGGGGGGGGNPPMLATAMSFAFDTPSPASTEPDHNQASDIAEEDDYEGDHAGGDNTDEEAADDNDSDAMSMDVEFEVVQGKLEGLELSDTDMEDSDSDSNFATDSDTSSGDSEESDQVDDGIDVGNLDDEEADQLVPPPEDGFVEDEPNPHIPPHFNSPTYEAWLAAQVPNILFIIRVKPLLPGSMIAAHSVRYWYRDYRNRAGFLDHIVAEYQLLDVSEISGFGLKERRTQTWVEFGADEETWSAVMTRIRNPYADENLTGSGMAVRAELKVLVGGDPEVLRGKVIEKGRFAAPDDDPDL